MMEKGVMGEREESDGEGSNEREVREVRRKRK